MYTFLEHEIRLLGPIQVKVVPVSVSYQQPGIKFPHILNICTNMVMRTRT
jgi:hypothetical protein